MASEGSLFSLRPTDRPGITEEVFYVTSFALIASTGFLPVSRVTSLFRAATTAGSLVTHSRDRSPDCIRSSCALLMPE